VVLPSPTINQTDIDKRCLFAVKYGKSGLSMREGKLNLYTLNGNSDFLIFTGHYPSRTLNFQIENNMNF
jgi:hypothetical protein